MAARGKIKATVHQVIVVGELAIPKINVGSSRYTLKQVVEAAVKKRGKVTWGWVRWSEFALRHQRC